MRRRLEGIVAAGAPGVIAAMRSETSSGREAVGVADTTTGRPRGVDEHFRIGSVTNPFTVLLQLVAEGRVELDETCRRLLNHTSGHFDYGDDPRFLEAFVGTAFPASPSRGPRPS
jgi:D-alanyl-D-alanine carboxypeptidase